MTVAYVSQININDINNSFSEGTQTIENNMSTLVTKIQNEADPSQSDLMSLQTITIQWQAMIQAESALIKGIGDTLKQVISNVGT